MGRVDTCIDETDHGRRDTKIVLVVVRLDPADERARIAARPRADSSAVSRLVHGSLDVVIGVESGRGARVYFHDEALCSSN